MATNKHASIRYNALDKCFRNPGRKYFIEHLVNACNSALFEFSGITDGVKKRQVFDDINFMESSQGWSIPLEKHKDGKRIFYRYTDLNFSISNQPINEIEANQLKETILMLSKFKGMPHFEWIDELSIRLETAFKLKGNSEKCIDFEQNPYLKGLEYFSILFNAIVYKVVLQVIYKSFKLEQSIDTIFHPYYLKQYNNRWFVFGLNEELGLISNFALDRIKNITELNGNYKENSLLDFDNYFDDCVGVTIHGGDKPQKIIIQIDNELWSYIETKPLHGSQKILKRGGSFVTIELFLVINFELITMLFSYGPGFLILEPVELAKHIKERAVSLVKKYS